MYLLIHEDGSLMTAVELADDVFIAADERIVDIVDVTGEIPMQYHEDHWHSIDKSGT